MKTEPSTDQEKIEYAMHDLGRAVQVNLQLIVDIYEARIKALEDQLAFEQRQRMAY